MFPIKYIENNLVFNHDGECFAYRNLTIPTGGAFLPFPMLHLSIYESLLFQIMDFHRLTNTVGCSLTTE